MTWPNTWVSHKPSRGFTCLFILSLCSLFQRFGLCEGTRVRKGRHSTYTRERKTLEPDKTRASVHGGHGRRRLGVKRILCPPERRGRLPNEEGFERVSRRVVYQRWRRAGESHLELSPEVKSPRTVQRSSTEHAALVTRPREEGERDGDGCVDADLAGLDIALKLAGRRSRLGEDGRSVTVCIQRPEKKECESMRQQDTRGEQ